MTEPIDLRAIMGGLALLISIVSLVTTVAVARQGRLWSVRPVLAFSYCSDRGWLLCNLGSGVALDVIVATKDRGEVWKHVVRIPPLAAGAKVEIDWVGHGAEIALGATYFDIGGRQHSSVWEDNITQIVRGSRLPNWKSAEITDVDLLKRNREQARSGMVKHATQQRHAADAREDQRG